MNIRNLHKKFLKLSDSDEGFNSVDKNVIIQRLASAASRAAQLKTDQEVDLEGVLVSAVYVSDKVPPFFQVHGVNFDEPSSTVDYLEELVKGKVSDNLSPRVVNGKTFRTKELNSAEEANDFMEKNPGFSLIDEENGKFYLALSADEGDDPNSK